jgi:ATP-dependent Clp protease ATP-binding subunit ClpB
LLLAIVQGNDAAAKLLKDSGPTEKVSNGHIKIYEGEKATANSTQEFNALNKYEEFE